MTRNLISFFSLILITLTLSACGTSQLTSRAPIDGKTIDSVPEELKKSVVSKELEVINTQNTFQERLQARYDRH